MNKYYTPKSGYTGRIFEEEVLGACKVRFNGYMSFRQAVDKIRSCHSGYPTNPFGEPWRLHQAVTQATGTFWRKVQMYSAVGSPLDTFHGIDGFFVFEGIIVTVDTTINRHKDEPEKASVLIRMDDALDSFETPAAEIGRLFRIAKSLGWKGVV